MIEGLLLFVASAAGTYSDTLPVDEFMALVVAENPEIKKAQDEAENDVARTGPAEPDWYENSLNVAQAIEQAQGSASSHVLGEWMVGGHSASISGDHPFILPNGYRTYSIRAYDGPVDYHNYYRIPDISETILFHYYGQKEKIGNARCSGGDGLEVIASKPWEEWEAITQILTMGVAQISRDETLVYCNIYSPAPEGGYFERSYTPAGEPYLLTNEDQRKFTVSTRAKAIEYLFGQSGGLRATKGN